VTRFFLLRHAAHDAIGHYLTGVRPGLHLNDAGRKQLPQLVAQFRDVKLSAVVSSPLERTRETAEPIAQDHGLELQFDERLLEYGIGDWTGRTFESLHPTPEWKRFNDLRSISKAPGGELMLEVQSRAIAALLDWRDRHPDASIAIVTHGDVVRAILLYLLGMPVDMLHRLEVTPGSISVFDLDPDWIRVQQVNGDTVPARP
jgi:broad specificity phosphatase PhoE